MKTIYKTKNAKQETLALYDAQIRKLGWPCRDIYLDTSFGQTHLVETGNLDAEPLLVFHGGNSTTSYNLLICRFLLPEFHIYAVDIMGHPGKSAENCLSPSDDSYALWAGEVIDGLSFSSMKCFGGSFGAGVLVKLICACPEKVKKAVLTVPSGINNAFPIGSVKMLLPLIQYRLTKKENYVRQAISYMSLSQEVDEDTLATVKSSFDYVKTKTRMPSNAEGRRLSKYTAPVLVMAAEKDCLFPARKVLPRAEKYFPNCTTCLLDGRGHMGLLTAEEKEMITRFLAGA